MTLLSSRVSALTASVAAAAFWLLCCAGAGAAEAGSSAEAGRAVLEEVMVVSRHYTPLQHAAATVTIIDRNEIERVLTTNIRDLVRYEPGITVRNDPVRFGIDSFAIRGIGGDRIVAHVDGVPVSQSFSIGALADSGRIYTDTDFIRRVEILRGPASALYGSDAIGGVVQMQTIDPRDLLSASETMGAQLRAGYRSETEGWSATALNAWRHGSAEMLLGYVHRDNHEADIAGGLKPNPRRSRMDQVLAKLVLPGFGTGGAGNTIEVTLETGRTRDKTVVNALLGTPPRFVNTTAMTGDDRAEHLRFAVEQSLAPAAAWADDLTWRLHVMRTLTEQLTDETRRPAAPRASTELHRSFTFRDEAWGASVIATKAVNAGSWLHQLVYGIDFEMGQATEKRDGWERNLDTGLVSNVILGEVLPLRDFPITRRVEAGIYIQDELRLADSRWRFTPGLRMDLYRLRPREDAMYREDNPSARPVKLDDQSLAPKLAVSYELTPRTSAFAQYARGFRAPPLEEVNIGLEIALFNYRAVPNPDLKAETSDGYEIGLRTRGDAWRATLSGHYTRFEDFIESRMNIGLDPATGMTLFQSRNLARARIYGIDLAARLDLAALDRFAEPSGASPLQGWSLNLNAAWARGDDLTANQPLNSVDPMQVNLIVNYDAPSGWGARLAATAVAAKNRVTQIDVPLYRTDDYMTLDAFAYVEIGARGRLNLALTNLTDERYITWIDVRNRAADDPLVPYAVHPGRSLSVNLSWAFGR
ncbi:hypothetical protein ACG33_10310 [Steroidobacter denitrificans]|uniref:TonB-dependent receptor n=1 Tax=Steroidobacter denitrificans TaxID=465721 RepID=A0A127FAN3_STEDE|nr:TonB-dependent hemoglobin/transferrin/lactoferrin family receptor [Steroidobacter denitrificans]AMN47483.1 hypothetical protein ACG33_10310 [Steroidobacter denitrificans]